MTATTSRAIRNVAIALAVGGGVVGTGAVWKRYGGLDPYSGLKKGRASDPSATIQASNVKIRHYQHGKLVAQADAKRLTMDQNQNGLVLSGVKNGVMQTAQGPMQFAAGAGVVRPGIRRVDVSGGVRVKGADFDVQSSTASINGIKGELRVPQTLSGRIQGGDFTASSLIHQPNTDYTLITAPHYKGKLPQSGDLPTQSANRVWEVKSESAEKKGNIILYEDARAADGEVIVMAPHIEQNRKTDVIVATGRATYRSAKADMIADTVTIYRKENRAEFSGNVVMLVRAKKDWDKPLPKDESSGGGLKPLAVELPPELTKISPAEKQRDEDLRSGKTLRDYPMNLKADTVTYWYKKGERHAVAKGSDATAYQKFEDGRWWRIVTAPEARYDGEKEFLDLLGDPSKFQVHMKNSIGDDFHSTSGKLSTKEDQTEEDEYSKFGRSYGTFADRDSTDDPRGAPAAKPADPKTDPKKVPPPGGGPKKDPS
jgi:lipopolysaccharide export system protein LptA